jgi:hypothetical protein
VTEALSGIDTVLHIASIFYSIAVIKAYVASSVKRAILVHTTGVYSHIKAHQLNIRALKTL